MYDLEDAITSRRSSRLFLRDKPVPQELIDEALELAVRAPSNSNIQPWQVVFASGSARDRLVEALLDEAESSAPKVPKLPEQFDHYRRDTGALVYGAMGIARHDTEGAGSRFCATGSSSGHRWPASSACTAISTSSTASGWACSCRPSCSP